MPYKNIKKEEELKIRIGEDYFSDFDRAAKIGNMDFCIQPTENFQANEIFGEQELTQLLWAEAKLNLDIIDMFAQLILTIGKEKPYRNYSPPPYLGAFDSQKMAFVSYDKVHHLFFINDFNWNVRPSNHATKEFAQIKELIKPILDTEQYLFEYKTQSKTLREFIKKQIGKARLPGKIIIDTDNYPRVYQAWYKKILPLIDVDFVKLKNQYNIQDCDFFVADLFINDDDPIENQVSKKDNLLVSFCVVQRQSKLEGEYEIKKEVLDQTLFGDISSSKVYRINEKSLEKYFKFWNRYKRPPHEKYHDEMIIRRDKLLPQDVRERKGSFFTPQKWVKLSQKHIADTLGEDWQNQYYVWDCCAGSGNLLAFLKNKERLFASTIDQGDVQSMKNQIVEGSINLLEENVFQFDFLNDSFFDGPRDIVNPKTGEITTRFVKSNLPQTLQNIIKDPIKRTKLVVYINPPYAESGNSRTLTKTGKNKPKTATITQVYKTYASTIGQASNELFTQFLIRIYKEIPDCKIANFSTLKNLQGSNFKRFREVFRPQLKKLFLIPANTFDNVNGQFPIGFFVWDAQQTQEFSGILADVYDKNGTKLAPKYIHPHNGEKINQWFKSIKTTSKHRIGFICQGRNDFQHVKYVHLRNNPNDLVDKGGMWINEQNLIAMVVYLSVQHCIKFNWLLDRDQFLYPNSSWENDLDFHNDCLAFALFHGQNRIRAEEDLRFRITYPNGEYSYNTQDGKPQYMNHWLPFTEEEIGVQKKFSSHFMTDFINGEASNKATKKKNGMLIEAIPTWQQQHKRTFSGRATEVFDAGRQLWIYYHQQENVFNHDASLYDIKEYFQGRNNKTRMNNSSTDEKYNDLNDILRKKLELLATQIADKVYEHKFMLP